MSLRELFISCDRERSRVSIECERLGRRSCDDSGVFVQTSHSAIPQNMPVAIYADDPAYGAVMAPLTPAGAEKLGLELFQWYEGHVLVLSKKINGPIQPRTFHYGAKLPYVFGFAPVEEYVVPTPNFAVTDLFHGCLRLKGHAPFAVQCHSAKDELNCGPLRRISGAPSVSKAQTALSHDIATCSAV